MNGKEIAVISDIHGNSLALKEVLRDIKRRGIKNIINLGDSLYGPLDPIGTYELIRESNGKSIAGNQDRFILENLSEEENGTFTLDYVKSLLNEEIIHWLKSLPFDWVYDDMIYCCHGTPQSDTVYLLESPEEKRVAVKGPLELEGLLKGIKQKIIICGHSHVSRVVETGSDLIVNCGSVGLPAYDDDSPVYHKMETFSPFSTYVILKIDAGTRSVERISVEYDFEKAAFWAEKNNRDDWAQWLRTGRVL